MSAAPALRRTTSRRGPRSVPARTASTSAAFSSGEPPESSDVAAGPSPSAATSTSRRRTRSGVTSWMTPLPSSGSSSTPAPWTTSDRSVPRRRRTSASFGAAAGSPTPTSWRRAPAGFVTGPSRLNAVRTPISRRVGPAWRIAGWKAGANRNAKPRLRSAVAAESASWSIRMPSASSTSADPERDVIARLPCFATGTPAAATMNAEVVEMLNVPEPSPPVPTMSIAPTGASTRRTRSRISEAKPASSSIVSPRMRSATSSAASWEGVDSPSITALMAR